MLCLVVGLVISTNLIAQQPNILWLSCEDMSLYLGSYGNTLVSTPNLDRLAAKGIRYTQAYANGVQCSPARSTMISGQYAPMLGMDWHRGRVPAPEGIYYPAYLREAGYFCTNNSKEDYNSSTTPDNLWDESNKNAHYKNRPAGQPFFSVFNEGITHMTRVATRDTTRRTPRTILPEQVTLPLWLPDLPEIRNDLAWHYDAAELMDQWVGEKLAELEEAGLAENTIIFFFSDHGGCLPGSKAYPRILGSQVPMLVYFPPAFAHLAPMEQPAVSEDLISFVDLAPTVLNLLDIPIPEQMSGLPLMGPEAQKRETVYIFRSNQGPNFIPARGITDGRYHLNVNFNTGYRPGGRQDYQWQMPAFQAWEVASMAQRTNSTQNWMWELHEAIEFYDLAADPDELHNLVADPEADSLIQHFLSLLLRQMKEEKDIGLYPIQLRRQETGEPLYDYVRRTNQNMEELIDMAFLAAKAGPSDIHTLTTGLDHDRPVMRYWAAIGLNQLARKGLLQQLPDEVMAHFGDEHEAPVIRDVCAEMMVWHHHNIDALEFLYNQFIMKDEAAIASLQNLGPLIMPLKDQLNSLLGNKKGDQFYLRSMLINVGLLPYSGLFPGED